MESKLKQCVLSIKAPQLLLEQKRLILSTEEAHFSPKRKIES
jgi:hypothetical protein